MEIPFVRCSKCGGGPVSPTAWERTVRGAVPVRSRCANCGDVTELDPDERRIVETV
jgi:uncharacterized OB-fold protein